jgi:hypothetical protein
MSDHAITHDLAALARLDALGVPKREHVLRRVHGGDMPLPVSEAEQLALVPLALAYARLAARRAWGIASVLGLTASVAWASIYQRVAVSPHRTWGHPGLNRANRLLGPQSYTTACVVLVIACATAWWAHRRAVSTFVTRVANAFDRGADARALVNESVRSSVAWWALGVVAYATCFGLMVGSYVWPEPILLGKEGWYVVTFAYEPCCGVDTLTLETSIAAVLVLVSGLVLGFVWLLPHLRRAEALGHWAVRWGARGAAIAITWWCRGAVQPFATFHYQLIAAIAIAVAVVTSTVRVATEVRS